MPSMQSLLDRLSSDHPHITFIPGESFQWNPTEKTIYYVENDEDAATLLLHELAHAHLRHSDYSRDIELVGMERDAWEYATTQLTSKYSVAIPDNVIQDHLDTYRDWLHARSICPSCSANGIQIDTSTYQCLICKQTWKNNHALHCQLRRYIQNTAL